MVRATIQGRRGARLPFERNARQSSPIHELPRLRGLTIAADLETTGLNAFRDEIGYIGYFAEDGTHDFIEWTDEVKEWWTGVCNDPTNRIVWHNGKFDLLFLKENGVDVLNFKAEQHCTMTMSKCLRSTEKWHHDLKAMGFKMLGRNTEDKDEVKEWLRANQRRFTREYGRSPNFCDAPFEVLERRGLWDVETTLYLDRLLRQQIGEQCPTLYETERELIMVCVDMESIGVRVDITKAKELRAQAQKDVAVLKARLCDLVGYAVTVTKKKKGVEHEVVEAFNPNSSAKHLPAAFVKVGIPLKYKTKPKKDKKTGERKGGGNWSFDEYAMVRYVSPPLASVIRDSGEEGWPADRFLEAIDAAVEEHDLPDREYLPPLVLKYRELGKMISTYYDNLIEKCVDVKRDTDGREYGILHCRFNPSEAKTGRFSSSDPNLQNMPRLLGPRECFVTRKGRWLFYFDYSQVEMRMFVHFAEDEGMAEAIDNDIHMYIATQVYKKDRSQITKEQRKRAKGTGFGILYGSGAATQAETLTKKGLPTSEFEAKRVITRYHAAFPSVRRVTSGFERDIQQDGYLLNPFGRRYHLKKDNAYVGINYMCQGTSADIIKAAMVKVWKALRDGGFKSRLLMTIHDEIVLEIPPCERRVVVPLVKGIMEELESYFVPITIDVEVTRKRWSEKRDYCLTRAA